MYFGETRTPFVIFSVSNVLCKASISSQLNSIVAVPKRSIKNWNTVTISDPLTIDKTVSWFLVEAPFNSVASASLKWSTVRLSSMSWTHIYLFFCKFVSANLLRIGRRLPLPFPSINTRLFYFMFCSFMRCSSSDTTRAYEMQHLRLAFSCSLSLLAAILSADSL